jgi:hypothetical protein
MAVALDLMSIRFATYIVAPKSKEVDARNLSLDNGSRRNNSSIVPGGPAKGQ